MPRSQRRFDGSPVPLRQFHNLSNSLHPGAERYYKEADALP